MNRTPVTSSNIKSVGYDPAKKILEVEFHDLSVYHYLNVPQSVYTDLMRASSHGSYLARYVKGVYSYQKIH